LEIKPLHDDSNNKENLKNKLKINSDSLFIFIKQVYQKSSYSSTVYVQSKLQEARVNPNNPQETDQLWNPISYQN